MTHVATGRSSPNTAREVTSELAKPILTKSFLFRHALAFYSVGTQDLRMRADSRNDGWVVHCIALAEEKCASKVDDAGSGRR